MIGRGSGFEEFNVSDISPEERAQREAEACASFEGSIGHIGDDEVEAAAETGEVKVSKLERSIPEVLRAIWKEIRLLIGLLRDYRSGAYREVSFRVIAVAAAAVLYFVSPFDVMPDFIPGLGYVDDSAVLLMCLKMLREELSVYSAWREARGGKGGGDG